MKRVWIGVTAGTLCGILGYAYFALSSPAEADMLERILALSPDSAAIQREVAAQSAANSKITDAQRRDLFAELFTNRFRIHEARMAVRARFVSLSHGPDRIKLMCPARMEPWNMDRLALVTWREAQACLGRSYDIDIYETFIGALPRKIGELRSSGEKTPVAAIRYAPDARLQPVAIVPALMHAAGPRMLSAPPTSTPLQARNSDIP